MVRLLHRGEALGFALLRDVDIEAPKWHDVGGFLLEHRERVSLDDIKGIQE